MAIRVAPFIERVASGPAVRRTISLPWRLSVGAKAIALAVILPGLLLAVWSVAVQLGLMRPQILPSPLNVAQTAYDLVASGDLFAALAVSLQRVVLGLAIGAFLGIVLGAATGRSRTADAYLGPTVRAICQIPTIAWLPFLMLVFGIGEGLKLALIAKACFWPLFTNTEAAMRTAPVRYHEVADVLELDRMQRLRFVIVPAALPLLAAGLRLGLSNAWHVLIVVEMVAAAAGIGHLMAWSRTLFQLDAVFVTIVAIGATGWLMDTMMRRLERRLSPWTIAS